MLLTGSVLLAVVACTPPEGPGRRKQPEPEPTVDTDLPPEPIDTAPPVVPPDPGAWLFEDDEIRVVRLTIGASELESLALAPESWVPADVAIDGEVQLDRIAVRLKGNGSFQPISGKPSWKLSFDRYEPDGEIDGLDELVLNNMVTDASYLRERLAYAVFREVGVPAPRASYVQVSVNDEPYGLYLMLDSVDGRFLKRWFADADGPLYEMFDVDLTPPEVWQLEHESGPDDRSALVGLAEVLADPENRVATDAAPFLDVPQFTAYFGASAVIGQFDAYPYSFPGDDVYLYADPADGRVDFLAHGADETFTDSFRPADYVFGLLAVRCLADVACKELWTAAVWRTQDTVESMDLLGELDDWSDVLTQELPNEPRSPWAPAQSRAARDAVRAFVEGRRARLEAMPGLD